jgi:hypothetical protein
MAHRPPRSTAATSASDLPAAFSLRRDVAEVEVWLTASDRAGRAVETLSPSEVTVSDNGQPVTTFSHFERREEPMVRWIVLVDGSDSMRRTFSSARAAAIAFMQQAAGSKSPAQVTYFVGRKIYCEADCANPLPREVWPEGETPLFDRLLEVAAGLEDPRVQPERTVIILFSDGEDNWSRSDLEGAVQSFQQHNVAVYSLSAHSPGVEYPGDRVLRRLSQATGGRAFFLKHYAEAVPVLSGIRNELRVQYVLGFRPATALPWSYHELKVAAPPALKLRVQARSGYMVQP